jgi:hypothetical protein
MLEGVTRWGRLERGVQEDMVLIESVGRAGQTPIQSTLNKREHKRINDSSAASDPPFPQTLSEPCCARAAPCGGPPSSPCLGFGQFCKLTVNTDSRNWATPLTEHAYDTVGIRYWCMAFPNWRERGHAYLYEHQTLASGVFFLRAYMHHMVHITRTTA